jgi:hypothetical protein
MQANIQPVTFFRDQATVLTINAVQVRQFGESGQALILCALMSDDGRIMSNQTVSISGTDYAAWGTDDDYILNYAMNALGLTPA